MALTTALDPTSEYLTPIPRPAGRRTAGWRKFLVDCYCICLEQMFEIRSQWYFYGIFSIVMPISMLFGFGRMGSAPATHEGLYYIVTGTAVFSVANEAIAMLALRIGIMQRSGMLVYYAALPINRLAFLLALLGSRLVAMLPGMGIALLVGAWMYDLPVVFSLWVLVVLVLTAMTLAGVGMVIGSVLKDPNIISAVTYVVLFVLLMAAPVFIPLEVLPVPLQMLGYLLPPTYAAEALRLALRGTLSSQFVLDVMVLFGFMVVSMVTLMRQFPWNDT